MTTSFSKALRRTYRRSNIRRRVLYAAAIVAAILGAAAAFRPESPRDIEPYEASSASVDSTSATTEQPQDEGARRLIYRHSVVPGGVYSDGEVRAAMRNDPVVAAHFTTLVGSKLRTEIVPHDRMVYVSYRKGNNIYWTRNKVLLRGGETILTNGLTEIRTRCGNCISDEPVTPVADDEPAAVEFDALVQDDEAAATIAGAPADAPTDTRSAPAHVQRPTGDGAALFVFPAAAPLVRRDGVDGALGPPTEQTSTDDVLFDSSINPVPVPEPSTYLLIGGGIAALLRRMRTGKEKRTRPQIGA